MKALLLTCVCACNRQEETRPARKTLQEAVFASGHLEQQKEYMVAATADGTIRALDIREGDSVSAGQVLVRIKSDVADAQLKEARIVYDDARRSAAPNAPQLAQLQVQIDLARAQADQDQLNFERYKALRSRNSASQLELEKAALQYKIASDNVAALEQNYRQAQDALALNVGRTRQQVRVQQAVRSDYQIGPDQAGVVLDVLKKRGELVRKGEAIARIGSGKHVIRLFVAEDDITRLRIGQQAIVQLNNYPDTTFRATITRILPAFNQDAQSYVAEAAFVKPPPMLLSGTQLQANIILGGARRVLVIPSSALFRGQFVQMHDGSERAIQTGQKTGSWVEVRAGLTEQDVIVLPGNNSKNEDR